MIKFPCTPLALAFTTINSLAVVNGISAEAVGFRINSPESKNLEEVQADITTNCPVNININRHLFLILNAKRMLMMCFEIDYFLLLTGSRKTISIVSGPL